MVTVSPKHHKRWVQTRRDLLKKTFTKTMAAKLKKSLIAGDAVIKKHPRRKWTPAAKYYVSSIDKAIVVKTDFMKDFLLAELVISIPVDAPWSIAFFAPMGDPLLICEIQKDKLTWKKLDISEKALKENQEAYLKKLSISLKRQMGFAPPKKKKTKNTKDVLK